LSQVIGLTTYEVLKFFHVTLAILAVGFNASYGVWLARAAREPSHQLHVLRGIKVLDDRFANPAYALLLVTGLAMVVVGDLSLATFWLGLGLGLYVVAVVLGLAVYTPTLRNQIRVLESSGPDSTVYRSLARRGQFVGILVGVIVIIIVFLMVTKPIL
jgi:uncharacterized membrane protein